MLGQPSDPDCDRLADHVLEVVCGAGYTIFSECVVERGESTWHITAVDSGNHRWIARNESRYRAAVLLATLVGIDLEA